MDNYTGKSEVQEDISAEADKHQVLSKELDLAINDLEVALARVLVPAQDKLVSGGAASSEKVNAVSPPRSVLANWMNRRNELLEKAVDRINYLRTRLDII